jgi:hypothetical protein
VGILNIIGNTNASVGGPVSASQGQPVGFIATGGIKTNFQSGSFIYTSHTFTSSGTFVINDGQILGTALLVGGGGGGRSGSIAGVGGEGGGAGGYLIQQNVFFNTASIQIPYVTSSFAITVGSGGAQNNSGSNSILSGSVTYDSKPPVLIAYGGGAGSGSGASGGGEAFTNQPTQGNNGGFRVPTTAPNTFASASARYSAPGGGSYIATGSGATYAAHNYWRLSVISGSTPVMTSIYFTNQYESTSSLGNVVQVWVNPPTYYGGGYPIPYCANYPNQCWTKMETENNCALICGGALDSGSATSNWPLEYYSGTAVAVDNIIFRAPYNSGNNVNNCSGSVQGGTNVLLLQYRDNITGSWVNKMSGSFIATEVQWVDYGPNMLGPGPIDCKALHKNGSFLMASQSWDNGGNVSGKPGESIANTYKDGNTNWYSGGGVGGAWSGVSSGSVLAPSGSTYIQDLAAAQTENAGTGGQYLNLNGGNATSGSGCGGGGGAVNDSASLRGTGGSGGSGIVVITYISGSAF